MTTNMDLMERASQGQWMGGGFSKIVFQAEGLKSAESVVIRWSARFVMGMCKDQQGLAA